MQGRRCLLPSAPSGWSSFPRPREHQKRFEPRRHHYCFNRPAAACVPRRRKLPFSVCRRHCAAPPSTNGSGLPPLVSRATEYYRHWPAAAVVPRRRTLLLLYVSRCRRAAPPNIISTELLPRSCRCFCVPLRRAHCVLFRCCRCRHCPIYFLIPAAWPRSSSRILRQLPSAYSNLEHLSINGAITRKYSIPVVLIDLRY